MKCLCGFDSLSVHRDMIAFKIARTSEFNFVLLIKVKYFKYELNIAFILFIVLLIDIDIYNNLVWSFSLKSNIQEKIVPTKLLIIHVDVHVQIFILIQCTQQWKARAELFPDMRKSRHLIYRIRKELYGLRKIWMKIPIIHMKIE